jgi:hypothetical protein
MSPLGRRSLRSAALACTFVLVAALGAGLVRLLPWLLAADVPLAVVAPFARALCAVAVETALLVGLPAGAAVGAAAFVERGEARALLALGASPRDLVIRAVPRVGLAAALAFAIMTAVDVDAQAPGRIALGLIHQGKASCEGAEQPRSVLVPMVGVTWLCFPGNPARVVGTLPRLGDRAWFTAADLAAESDLRSFVLTDLRLVTRRQDATPRLNLRVDHAVVSGLSAWGRLAKLPTVARAALVSAVAAVLALLAAWLVVTSAVTSRVASAAIGALAAVAAVRALHWVDGGPGGWLAYAWVPVSGCATAAVCWLVWMAVLRVKHRRRAVGI